MAAATRALATPAAIRCAPRSPPASSPSAARRETTSPRPARIRLRRPQTGDQWCLCAPRWQEAFQAGCAPAVVLAATHEAALFSCDLEDLKAHAAPAPDRSCAGSKSPSCWRRRPWSLPGSTHTRPVAARRDRRLGPARGLRGHALLAGERPGCQRPLCSCSCG